MKRFLARTRARGVAAIEFALVAMLFCILLFGMIDYGWYFFVDLVSTNAVREGARAATTIAGPCPNTAALSAGDAAIRNYFSAALPRYTPSITSTCTTIAGEPRFQFVLQVDFAPVSGLTIVPMPAGANGATRVRTVAVMRGVP